MTANDPDADIQAGKEIRSERIAGLLAECSDRMNAGEPVDIAQVVEQHGDLEPELSIALEALHGLGRDVPPGVRPGVLGDYTIVREVGRGGMGVIYEAWQVSMDRRVAVKVLAPGLLASPRAVARFEREARAAGRLHHPNVVSVHAAGSERGTHYIAMELVEGETLDKVLDRLRPPGDVSAADDVWWETWSSFSALPRRPEEAEPAPGGAFWARPETEVRGRSRGATSSLDTGEVDSRYCARLAEAFAAAAEGLHHAHQNGVIHRDIKPSNLILDGAGRLRILDFSLALVEGQEPLTATGERLGTPLYMSPEQARGPRTRVDHRTDVYSLGATLYEMLTWRPPFRGADHHEVLSQIASQDPVVPRKRNPRISKDLETIVLKCLRKEPEHRYRTAEALAQDLRRFARGEPIEARPQPAWEKLARRAWRYKGWTAALLSFLGLCIVSAALAHKGYRERVEAMARDYDAMVRGAVISLELGRPALKARRDVPGAPRPHERVLSWLLGKVASAATREPALAPWPDPVAEAVRDLERAAALLPRRPEAHYHLARGLWLLGREGEALNAAEEALEVDPGFVPAAALCLETLGGAGKGEAASRAAEPEPRVDWREAWSAAHRSARRKDWRAAAAAYTRLIDGEAEGQPAYSGSSIEARVGRGRARLEARDLDGALEDFGAARALWPDRLEPVLLLAKLYLLKEEIGRAEEMLEAFFSRARIPGEVALRAAALHREAGAPEKGLAWAERIAAEGSRERVRAELLWGQGRLEDAARAVKRVIELEPADARAHNFLGVVLEDLGQPEEARAAYTRALELDLVLALARYNLAGLLEARGSLDGAAAEYRKAIGLDPGHAPSRNNLGLLLASRGKLDEAVAELRAAVAADPGLAAAHDNLGLLLGAQGKLDEAAAAHGEAVRLDPRSAGAHDHLGETLRLLGDLEGALASHLQAVVLDPESARARVSLGIALQETGDLEGALAAFREAAALDPELASAHANLGNALARRGDAEAARKHLERAIELDPSLPHPHISLGSLQAGQGLLEPAIASHEKALAACEALHANGSPPPWARRTLFRTLDALAGLATKAGRLEEARAWRKRALALEEERTARPDAGVQDLHEHAWILLTGEPEDLRDPARGLELARRANDLAGGKDPLVLDTLALAHFLDGDPAKAVEIQEEALRLLPGSSPHRGLLEASLARFREGLGAEGRENRR